MNSAGQPRIVVGVSGSRASVTALRWAADEVQRRHGQLRIVRIWEQVPPAKYAPRSQRTPDEQRAEAAQTLADAVKVVFGGTPPDNVTTELTEGMAERALVNRSEGADLLVLGSTSPATRISHSMGAVIRSCLSRAHCPVVVVGIEATSEDAEDAIDRPRGRQPVICEADQRSHRNASCATGQAVLVSAVSELPAPAGRGTHLAGRH